MTKTLCALANLALACSPLTAAPDTVDTTWAGFNYFDTNEFGGPASMLIQPDGKLLLGSNWMSAQNGALFLPLTRFNVDGTVDEIFHADNTADGAGSGIFYDLQGQPEVHGLALQSDGKIIAVGCMQGMRDGVDNLSSTKLLQSNGIVRITPGGDPDTTFQSAGIDIEFIDEVLTLPDDKILIMGGFNSVRNQGGPFVAREGIARLNADGSLDTAFNLNPASLGSFDAGTLFIRQAAVTPNGKVYVVGNARPAGGTFTDSVAIFSRLNSDGSPDASFSPSLPAGVNFVSGVVLEPDGKVVALGGFGSGASDNSFMGRFSDTGTPDGSFTLDASLPMVSARPLRRDPLGKYILTKRDPVDGNSALVRVNADGSRDNTFNVTGSWNNPPFGTGPSPAFFNQSITSPTGKVYAGGGFDTVNGEPSVKVVAFDGDEVPNSPGTIQLASFAFSASECDGNLLIPVVRISGATGAASVDYSFSTALGNATAGADFDAAGGTISFAAGEAGTKYISVPLVDDSDVESPEVFTINLANATGAALGTPTEGFATIIDGDSPPVIALQPEPLFVPPFEFFQIAVGALSGKDPTTYQWFKDGVAISGATSPLYFETNASAVSHNGEYCVVVTNPNGSTTSDKVDIVVKDPAELSFAVASTQATENDGSVTLTLTRSGSSVNAVSVGITLTNNSASPADYTLAPTTVSWADGDTADKTVTVTLTDDGDIEPQETFIATLANYSPDARPGVNSSLVFTILDDDSPLSITTQPTASQSLQEDEALSLSISATSQTPLSYQWLSDGIPLSGETSDTLILDPIGITGAGTYTVEITNTAGTITSNPAIVTVTPAPYLTAAAPDTSDLDFDISAISLIDNTTAWIAGNSSTLGHIVQRVSTNPAVPTLTIPVNSTVDQLETTSNGGVIARGSFTTVDGISQGYLAKLNPDGTLATGQIPVTNNPVTFAIDTLDRILLAGGGFGLTRFNSDGSQDTTFSNFPDFGFNPTFDAITVDGTKIFVGGRFNTTEARNGITKLNDDGSRDTSFEQTNFNLRTRSIRIRPDGKVILLAQNTTGTVSYFVRSFDSDGTYLNNGPSLGSSYQPDFEIDNNNLALVPSNQSLYFRRLNDTLGADTTFNAGIGDFNGPVKGVEVDEAGRIWIIGSFTQLDGTPVSKLVILNGDPAELAIVTEPALTFVDPGANVSLTVDVISSGPVSYQWRKNGINIPGATSGIFTITGATNPDAALYDVIVTNNDTSLSLTSDSAELIVLGAPVITRSPSSTTAIEGGNLTLDADFHALAPVTFQWQKGGVDIPGATSATYDISSSNLSDSGLYTFSVTNSLGSATTAAVNIQFIPDPAQPVAGFVPLSSGSGSITRIVSEPNGGSYIYGNYFTPTHPSGTLNSYFNRIDTNGAPGPAFAATSNQQIRDLARDSSGNLVLVGSNFFLNSMGSRRIARISADGTSDTVFDSNVPFLSPQVVAIDSQDRIYVAGSSFLTRLNSNGTVDNTFSATFSGSAIELRIDDNDQPLLLGQTTLVRYNQDGSNDSTFTFDPTVPTFPSFVHFDLSEDGTIAILANASNNRRLHLLDSTGTLVNSLTNPGFSSGSVSRVAIQSNGKLLISSSSSPYLARILPDGTSDPLFDLGTGFNSSVNAIEVVEDGNIWVGGGFTQFNGSTAPLYVKLNGDPVDVIIAQQPQSLIADISTSGSLNVIASGLNAAPISYQWQKNGIELPGQTSASLSFASLAESDEGSYEVLITNLITGRERKSSGATVTVLADPEIVTFTDDERNLEVDDELNLSVDAIGAGTLNYQWQKDGLDIVGATNSTFIISMTEESDSGSYQVTITNALSSVTSAPVAVSVLFSPAAVSAVSPDISFNGTIEDILPLPDGRTLVAGGFSSVSFDGSNYFSDEIALINADGTLDTTFDLTPNSTIYSLALDTDGGVLIGGRFNFIGGQSKNRIARLNPDLTLDTSFGSNVGPNGDVFTFEPTIGGKYFVGGQFSSWDGNHGYLVRLNSDGSFDDSFVPPALNTVRKVIPLPDGKVFAGGAFNISGAARVARFNGDGSIDTSYTASSPRFIFDMVLQPDGKLIAVGDFGGAYRYQTNGSQDNTFSPSINNDIESIALDASGKILVAGTFTTVNGEASNRLARLNSDGSTDETFDVRTGANSTLREVALQPLGGIWIGGSHTEYRDIATGRFTLLNGDPLDLAIVQQPSSTAVDPGTTATFSVTAVGTDTLSYQWQRNGVILVDGGDISGTTSNTLTIASTENADEDNYRVTVTHSMTGEMLTSDSVNLLVLGAPEILAQPESITTEVTFGATFSVSARGASPVTYQWYRDGSILTDNATVTGSTTNEVTLTNLGLTDSSSLFVRISNSLGTLDSDTVTLLVERLPASIDRSIVLPTSINSTVLAVCPLDDGSYILGGQFTSINYTGGSASRRYLAKFDAAGVADLSFPVVVSGSNIRCLDVDSNGKTLVGGRFTSLNANGTFTNRTNIARINADGTVDTTFDALAGPNNDVYDVKALPDGKILIGGSFTSVNGETGTSRIARLNSDGTVDTSFTSQATGNVSDIALVGSDYWLNGGSNYAGNNRNVRIDDTGAVASGFLYSGSMTADKVVATSDGGALLGADSYPYLEKVDGNGIRDITWPNLANNGQGPNNRVYGLANLGSARNIVAGTFSTYSGISASNIMVIDNDGNPEPDFLPETGFGGNYPRTVKADSLGRIWCGGTFTTYKGETVSRLVVLNGYEPAPADPFLDYVNSLPAGEQGEGDDPDGDNQGNLIEYAYGTLADDPTSSTRLVETQNIIGSATINSLNPGSNLPADEVYYTVTFRFPDDPRGVTLTPEATLNLPDFEDGSAQIIPLGNPVDDGDHYLQQYYLTPARSTAPRAFTRLKATRN